MDAAVLVDEVVTPVLGPVTVGAHRSKLEHGLGTVEGPSGASDVEAVADHVADRSFDHPSGDRPPLGQGCGVVEVGRLVLQVAGALVGFLSGLGVQLAGGGLSGDRAGDDPGFAFEDREGLIGDLLLGCGVALVKEAPTRNESWWMFNRSVHYG